MNVLPSGTILKGKSYQYTILKVLGQGTFGITYLASVKMTGALGSINADIKVAIKEFFMQDINGRSGTSVTSGSKGGVYDDYKKKFAREALNLSKLQHPNIIKVVESFESNNTVYYVMEYIEGGNLDDYILKEKGLEEDAAVRLIRQIGGALSYMHGQKMLHLDLKPKNVMLRKDGEAVLIDFGLSKQYNAKGEPESSTRVGQGTPGYAPIEQASYRDGKGFPVTMDVYALGATMFKMLTAVRPPEASEILNEGFPLYELKAHNVSDSVCASVAKAMAPLKKDRFLSIEEFLSSMDEEITILDDITDHNKPARHMEKNGMNWQEVSLREKSFIEYENLKDHNRNQIIDNLLSNMVYVEGSTFIMGSDDKMFAILDVEFVPFPHKVTLSSFHIGRYPVTQEEWEFIMGENPSSHKGTKLPVHCVKWEDCQLFINKLNALTRKNFRLPTEAEWEYAARGGNKSKGYRYSGSDDYDDVAWCLENSGDRLLNMEDLGEKLRNMRTNNCRPHPVGLKHPNELGIYDMSGNVEEWCQDGFDIIDCREPQFNPCVDKRGWGHVFRGGGWYSTYEWMHVSARGGFDTEKGIGMRLVLS